MVRGEEVVELPRAAVPGIRVSTGLVPLEAQPGTMTHVEDVAGRKGDGVGAVLVRTPMPELERALRRCLQARGCCAAGPHPDGADARRLGSRDLARDLSAVSEAQGVKIQLPTRPTSEKTQ